MGLLVSSTAWVCWAVADWSEADSTNGWAAIIDKHAHAQTTSGTVWLVGGSNVMFGYNSDYLTTALRRPTINMGIGAALGLPFMLNEALAVAKPGDIVVLSLEYNLRHGDYNAQLCAADFYPPARHYIHYPDQITWLKANAHYQLRKAKNGLNTILYGYGEKKPPTVDDTLNVYFRSAFSKRGDLISHLNNPRPQGLNFDSRESYSPYHDYINHINDFVRDAQKTGISVFFTYPPIAKATYQANQAVFAKWQHELTTHMTAKILTEPTSTVYPDTLFFDTEYHLTEVGRDQHTQLLLSKLKPYCP